jgi:hypothetical protein
MKNEDELDNFYLDDDEDDFIESHDDLVLGIDNILSFDLENPLIYTKKDKFFFVFTLLLLLFNGYIITGFIYFIIGYHMSLKTDETEEDTQEAKDSEILQDLTYRTLYIYNLKNKKKYKKKSKKYLTINERLNICNKCNYKYYNNDSLKNIYNSSSNLKKEPINDYKYFLNIYYNLLYFNYIKYSNNNIHIYLILLNKYKLDLIKLNKYEENLFQNVKINNYNYFYLNKEITYNYQLIKPNKKIIY